MATPKETQWEIDPHTQAKHAILQAYLEAWFAILTSAHDRVVYVDGFCGPGRYKGGEPGSPLIALDVATKHTKKLTREIFFLFTDEREDRIAHLKTELASRDFPDNFKPLPRLGKFDEVLSPILTRLEDEGRDLPPTFVFIDPFGFSGVPFDLVRRILLNPRCEVFITFMVNAVQRFLDHPNEKIRAEIEELFGTPEAFDITQQPGARVELLRDLYHRQLQASVGFVRSFEIRDTPNHVLYYLFFASDHFLGHKRMKEAMWRVDPEGKFSFVDTTDRDQIVLLTEDQIAPLRRYLLRAFAGRTIACHEVLQRVMNETPYLDKHTRKALGELAYEQMLRVEELKESGKKRRKGTFPEDCIMRLEG